MATDFCIWKGDICMIEISGLVKKYGRKSIFNEAELTLPSRGLVVIHGQNGAGKTTLLNILGLTDQDFEGKVSIDGTDIKGASENQKDLLRKNTITYIFQKDNLIDFLDVSDNVGLRKIIGGNYDSKEITYLAKDFSSQSPKYLSDGEKILVALERGLNSKAKIFLLDEVSGFLDQEHIETIVNKIKEISIDHLVLFVSHDTRIISDKADFLLLVEKGKIIVQKKADDLLKAEGKNGTEEKTDNRETKCFAFFYLLRHLIQRNFLFLLISIVLETLCIFGFSYYLSPAVYDYQQIYQEALKDGQYVNISSGGTCLRNLSSGKYLPIEIAGGMTEQQQIYLEENFSSDIYYLSGDILCSGNSSLNSLLLSKKYYSSHSKYLLPGNELSLNCFGFSVVSPYSVDDSVPPGYVLTSLSYLKTLDPLSGVKLKYSLWNNGIYDFSELSDIEMMLSSDQDLFSLTYISQTLFEERSGLNLAENINDNEIIIGSSLKEFSVSDLAGFFNPSDYDFEYKDKMDFIDLNNIFPAGALIREEDAVSSLLGKNEVVVSDNVFSEIIDESRDIPLKVYINITKENKKKIASFVSSKMLWLKVLTYSYPFNSAEAIEINGLLSHFGGYSQLVTYGTLLSFAVLSGVFDISSLRFIDERTRKSQKVLISCGFGRKKTKRLIYFFTVMSIAISLLLGILGTLVFLPSSIFNSSLEILPKISLNIYAFLIVFSMEIIFFFLAVLINSMKKHHR